MKTIEFVNGKGKRKSEQSEGAFGVIKEDMEFRRFLQSDIEKVTTEILLLSMATIS